MSAEELLIISNNPAVKDIGGATVCRIEGDALSVLYEALKMTAAGYILLSHPLAGNVRLEDNYYRSIVFSADLKDRVDFNHLRLLNRCLIKLEEQQNGKIPSERLAFYDLDFQIMDAELLHSALCSLLETDTNEGLLRATWS